MGWTVISFWGKDIKKDVNCCVKFVEETIFNMHFSGTNDWEEL